jgi:RTX calcium-binding nonapeptide repeat (4 copies)
MSGVVRVFAALLWVSTVSLTWVPAVEAATVSLSVEEHVDSTLTFQAAPGEANEVAVMLTTHATGWIVTEAGVDSSGTSLALTSGPGCTSLTPEIALCEHGLDDFTETPQHVVLLLGDSPVIPFDFTDRAQVSDACGPLGPNPFGCTVRISGGEGVDIVFASDAGDASRSVVNGGPGADHLFGGENGSRLIGGGGNDTLTGGPGRDTIGGGRGRDTIRGGSRPDELRGGAGRDTFYARDRYRDHVFGGLGRDRARVDRLLDRVRSIERLF